ncbi:MAG TPA: hypothetical protein VGP88_01920, partial [Thermoplasmata archaeon]|nr:hypothetical protein [Thermoplasmata archaeon]
GLQPGDLIVRIAQQTIQTLHDLLVALSRVPIGGAVDVAVQRGAAELKTIVRVVEAPVTETAVAAGSRTG